MNAKPNRDDSVRTHAHVANRQMSVVWFAFVLSKLFIYVVYEHLNWISLLTARVLLGFFVVLLWCAPFFVKLRHALNCASCGLDLFKFSHEIKESTWRYCPECACSTHARPQDSFNRGRKPATSIASAYQLENIEDTTRHRAIRWRNAMTLVMGNFFLLMFIVMPGAFVGPWKKEIAAHWYWVVLAALLPYIVWVIAAKFPGLRCVHCDHKFRTDTQAFLVAYKKPDKHFWHFCPHCAHSLDTEKSVATSTRI
jgi:MFS family permease